LAVDIDQDQPEGNQNELSFERTQGRDLDAESLESASYYPTNDAGNSSRKNSSVQVAYLRKTASWSGSECQNLSGIDLRLYRIIQLREEAIALEQQAD
jgi:hypothetical protein